MKIALRSAFAAPFVALALTACGAAEETASSAGGDGNLALEEMTLGDEDAPVEVIEYASWTCPACLQFHEDVVSTLKSDYVETGKVKFIFREFPTAPQEVSIAGFAIARCTGDGYFDTLDDLFARQNAILGLVRNGGQVRAALREIARNNGITEDEAFEECLRNSDVRRAIAASVRAGDEDGVQGTPTVLVDGEVLRGYDWRTVEGMRAVLDEALGEDTAPAETAAPEPAPAPDEEGTSIDDNLAEEGQSDDDDTTVTVDEAVEDDDETPQP